MKNDFTYVGSTGPERFPQPSLLATSSSPGVMISFIRQDNTEIPDAGDSACHMVSKRVTNENLPNTATFDGPAGAKPDPDTFRVEVRGLATDLEPQIEVEITRSGNRVFVQTFATVEGVLGGDTVYRTNEHVRLVSNTVDDNHLGHQTPLVKLGDTVKATLIVDSERSCEVELPVARPPRENGPNAIRTCDINFITLQNTKSDPALAVKRLSEDWAQMAIRFRLVSSETVVPVTNVLTVKGNATAPGMLKVDVTNPAPSPSVTTTVSVPVAMGETAKQIAGNLATEINGKPGLTASTHIHKFLGDEFYIVLVNPRFEISFANFSSVPGVVFQQPMLDFTDSITTLEGHVLALNFRDTNPNSIDVFAIGPRAILDPAGSSLVGGAIPDSLKSGLPGLQNSVFVREEGVDAMDGKWFTLLAHEVGHVLLDDVNHHSSPSNIMIGTPASNDSDMIGGEKRFDAAQHLRVRSKSGPSTTPSLLQKR